MITRSDGSMRGIGIWRWSSKRTVVYKEGYDLRTLSQPSNFTTTILESCSLTVWNELNSLHLYLLTAHCTWARHYALCCSGEKTSMTAPHLGNSIVYHRETQSVSQRYTKYPDNYDTKNPATLHKRYANKTLWKFKKASNHIDWKNPSKVKWYKLS